MSDPNKPALTAADWLAQAPGVPAGGAPMRVAVVDVNMPFASMVGFMVKWALAAIPAVIILAFVGFVTFAILGSAIGTSLR